MKSLEVSIAMASLTTARPDFTCPLHLPYKLCHRCWLNLTILLPYLWDFWNSFFLSSSRPWKPCMTRLPALSSHGAMYPVNHTQLFRLLPTPYGHTILPQRLLITSQLVVLYLYPLRIPSHPVLHTVTRPSRVPTSVPNKDASLILPYPKGFLDAQPSPSGPASHDAFALSPQTPILLGHNLKTLNSKT